MRRRCSLWLALVVLVGAISCGSGSNAGSTSSDDVKAPTDLKAVPLDGGAHLTWTDNSDNEAEFMLERMVGSADWSTLATVPFNTTQYHDAPLTPGTTYMYRVMAVPKSGNHAAGKYSNEVTLVAPAAGSGGAAGSGH